MIYKHSRSCQKTATISCQESPPTFGSLCAVRVPQAVSQVRQPSIFDCGFEDLSVVQTLEWAEVVTQVFHGFNMILLFCGEDGVERLQLCERERERI